MLHHEYWTDSAGAGQWRGGLGVITRLNLGGEGTTFVTFGEGDVEQPLGTAGGKPGALNSMKLTFPDGKEHVPTTKDLIPGIPTDTTYYQEAGGGGGCGDPLARPADKVLADVRNEKVSLQSAKDDYGVVIDPKTMTIDQPATDKLRNR